MTKNKSGVQPQVEQLYVEDAASAIHNKRMSYGRRYASAIAWITSLRTLAELLPRDYSLEYAADIVKYDAGLSLPVGLPGGRWGMQRYSFDEYIPPKFYIAPMVASDEQLHPYFGGIVGKVTYREPERTIYLPPNKLSNTWKGLILFHEVLHAE